MSQETSSFRYAVKNELLQLLKDRITHFQSFRYAANLRGQRDPGQPEQLRQFKTEKWLQAELVHHLWNKGFKVIPEYSKAKWDLYVLRPDNAGGFMIALKCFADSGQSAAADYGGTAETKGIRKDLKAILDESGSAAFALILPLATEKGDKDRCEYCTKMLQRIKAHRDWDHFEIETHRIPFTPNANEGVLLLWIERKR